MSFLNSATLCQIYYIYSISKSIINVITHHICPPCIVALLCAGIQSVLLWGSWCLTAALNPLQLLLSVQCHSAHYPDHSMKMVERSQINDTLSVKEACGSKIVIINVLSFAHAAKVGKTSLIMSLVSEEFPDEVSSNTLTHKYDRNHLGSCLQSCLCHIHWCLSVDWLLGYVRNRVKTWENKMCIWYYWVCLVAVSLDHRPLSFRFLSEPRRSPSQLMSPQRGCPHTLWTTQVIHIICK